MPPTDSHPAQPLHARPRFVDDEAFRCLRSGELGKFHQIVATRASVDFFFPADIAAEEIRLSLEFGTRLRKRP
jgi:hypothetical protein